MHFRPFRVISDRNECLGAFQSFKKRFQKDSQVFPEHGIGWQGGSRAYTVYWQSSLNIWGVLEPAPPIGKLGLGYRFWNCFGIDNPTVRKLLPITVEINMPHQGEDRRVAGLFARDGNDRVYLAHSGKVGGGRQGIGPSAFRDFLGDEPWHEIGTKDGTRMAVVLGPIDGQDFLEQLAQFVRSVATFKQGIAR